MPDFSADGFVSIAQAMRRIKAEEPTPTNDRGYPSCQDCECELPCWQDGEWCVKAGEGVFWLGIGEWV